MSTTPKTKKPAKKSPAAAETKPAKKLGEKKPEPTKAKPATKPAAPVEAKKPAKAEPAKKAEPKAESKKPEAPKAQPAKKAEPKAEAPKTEAPKSEAPALAPVKAAVPAGPPCEKCGKPAAICVCDRTERFKTKLGVVILQHPQELDVELATVPIAALSLAKCEVRAGLSWASLSHALGREIDPKRWAVLWSGSLERELTAGEKTQPLLALDRHAAVLDVPAVRNLEGIVALDGTWSQAKTLWWRNAWLLKHPRILLHPKEPSVYGSLRKEPKRESLSTLEAIANALVNLGEDANIEKSSRRALRTLCQRARDVRAAQAPEKKGPPPGHRGKRRKGKGAARDKSDVL